MADFRRQKALKEKEMVRFGVDIKFFLQSYFFRLFISM